MLTYMSQAVVCTQHLQSVHIHVLGEDDDTLTLSAPRKCTGFHMRAGAFAGPCVAMGRAYGCVWGSGGLRA